MESMMVLVFGVAAREAALETARAELQSDSAAFEAMKARMSSTLVVKDDDIVELSVGGQPFTCLRSTLRRVKGSLLDNMFGQPWFEQLRKDPSGRIFLDWDPDLFSAVLTQLRASVYEADSCVMVFDPKDPQLPRLRAFQRYLLLDVAATAASAPAALFSDSFDVNDSYPEHLWTFDGRGTSATLFADGLRRMVRGKAVIKFGQVTWTLKCDIPDDSADLYVGVMDMSVAMMPTLGGKCLRDAQFSPGFYFVAVMGATRARDSSLDSDCSWCRPLLRRELSLALCLDAKTLRLTSLTWNGTQAPSAYCSYSKLVQPSADGWRLCVVVSGARFSSARFL